MYMNTNILYLIISRSILLRMRHAADKSCRENQNTHFVSSNFPPPLPPNVGKYCRIGQATDGNMAHALCMLDN